MKSAGKVYLVGAGPGDPDLISVRGRRVLSTADEVLYDYLVNPEILQHARSDAECLCLGSHSKKSIWKPADIHARLLTAARQGKQVVRLKSGDPVVFGRAAGEIDQLVRAGIDFEIVPGITAGLSAACYAGIPVTDRDLASAVAFVTGQENPGKNGSSLDYEALARFPGSLVFYMGVTTADSWTSKLMASGMPPDRPVALVRRSTWPDQQVVVCRLDEVVAHVTPYSKFPPPAVAIVGEVARHAEVWNWFERRPLSGITVVLPRPRDQAEPAATQLRDLGAHVVVQPAVSIEPPESWEDVDASIAELPTIQTVVFTSSNGVRNFMDRLLGTGRDLRALGHTRIAAVGTSTVETLSAYSLRADLVPAREFNAESLLDLLLPTAAGHRFLLVRGSRGRGVLRDGLRTAGGEVREAEVYRSLDVDRLAPGVAEVVAAADQIWVTATSPAIARSIDRLLGKRAAIRWACISPLTAETVRHLGHAVTCEAEQATMESLIDALVRSVRDSPGSV